MCHSQAWPPTNSPKKAHWKFLKKPVKLAMTSKLDKVDEDAPHRSPGDTDANERDNEKDTEVIGTRVGMSCKMERDSECARKGTCA